jgi:hypothetical protein
VLFVAQPNDKDRRGRAIKKRCDMAGKGHGTASRPFDAEFDADAKRQLQEFEDALAALTEHRLALMKRVTQSPDRSCSFGALATAHCLSGALPHMAAAAGGVRHRQDDDGWVYLIEAGQQVALKIGWALDPGQRLRTLQTGCPLSLHLLACFKGTRKCETAVRGLLSDAHLRGEWINGGALHRALAIFSARSKS